MGTLEEKEVFPLIWVPRGWSPCCFGFSLVLHGLAVMLLYMHSFFSYGGTPPLRLTALERDYEITYYQVSKTLPNIISLTDAAKEPVGEKKETPSSKGNSLFHPTQTIQSLPPKADNPNQTIIQSEASNVQIQEILKVSNMVVWNIPKSKVQSTDIVNQSITPLITLQLKGMAAAISGYDLKSIHPDLSSLRTESTLELDLPAPQTIPVETPPDSKLNEPKDIGRSLSNMISKLDSINSSEVKTFDLPRSLSLQWTIDEIENIHGSLSEMTVPPSFIFAPEYQPDLPNVISPQTIIGSNSFNPVLSGGVVGHNLKNIVILSANPDVPKPATLHPPQGNRRGTFSISLNTNKDRLLDSTHTESIGGGIAVGGGKDEDSNGHDSGSDIAQIKIAGLSVKGKTFNQRPLVVQPGDRLRSPSRFKRIKIVEDPGESYNITVVEGSHGGAGLGIYGILTGQQNYTVFIPMPSGRWTMQFSQRTLNTGELHSNQASTVISIGNALIQPRPLHKVDPLLPEKENLPKIRGQVVVYAIIHIDGSLDKIRVVRSLHPTLDEQAIISLRQWKFKPAHRDGQPIEVEALFGIPFNHGQT